VSRAPELKDLSPARQFVLRLMSAAVFGFYRILRGDRIVVGRGSIANHRLIIKGPGRVIIGAEANLFAFGAGRRTRLVVRRPGATIRIGARARLNGTELHADTSIDIGADSILGQAFVADTDAHSVRPDRRSNPAAPVRSAPVVVEANVWVARAAAILPGVRIGEGSVVGYGSVVTSDVPARVVVAGNPAHVVRHLDEVG
jgi:carbonic anhydrase/acetyltransferase-like protein (isoleucine patch superfamily)